MKGTWEKVDKGVDFALVISLLDGQKGPSLHLRTRNKEQHQSTDVSLCSLSHVRLFATPWTVAHQAPLPLGFSRQEYKSRFPFPTTGDLPNPGIKPEFLVSPALAGGFFTTSATWEAQSADNWH